MINDVLSIMIYTGLIIPWMIGIWWISYMFGRMIGKDWGMLKNTKK